MRNLRLNDCYAQYSVWRTDAVALRQCWCWNIAVTSFFVVCRQDERLESRTVSHCLPCGLNCPEYMLARMLLVHAVREKIACCSNSMLLIGRTHWLYQTVLAWAMICIQSMAANWRRMGVRCASVSCLFLSEALLRVTRRLSRYSRINLRSSSRRCSNPWCLPPKPQVLARAILCFLSLPHRQHRLP